MTLDERILEWWQIMNCPINILEWKGSPGEWAQIDSWVFFANDAEALTSSISYVRECKAYYLKCNYSKYKLPLPLGGLPWLKYRDSDRS